MKKGLCAIVFVLFLFIGSAGCLSSSPAAQTISEPTPQVTASPTPESPISTTSPSGMALRPADIPSDYILKERSELFYSEMSQLSRDLGWREGYSATYYRMNKAKSDTTVLRQIIGVYPLANMNKVYNMAKDEMVSQTSAGSSVLNELPLTRIGDASIAYKTENMNDPNHLPVYTIFFIKKDVIEKLEMGGTTTDYETLKDVARTAAAKIR